MVEEKRENNNNKQTLPEKKEEAGNVSEQRDKGWIHVIRVHDTTHLVVTTTLRGSRRSRTTPHKERLSDLVKHRDYPPHSYIVNDRYNPRNKRASKEKNSQWQEQVTSPTPNPNPGRPRNRESNKTFSSLHMMKQTRINWENKIKQLIKGRLHDEV